MAEQVSGSIFLRKWPGLPAGHVVDGHTHNFDHTTIVFTGAVRVKAVLPDGRALEREFRAPTHFLVKAEVQHRIEALEDGTEYWCVYSHRDPQSKEVVQGFNGWGEAYG